MTAKLSKRSRLSLLREAHAIDEAGGLWHLEHVAAVLGLSPRAVRELPGLVPVKLRGSGLERPIRRYDPEEVRAWARAQSPKRKSA